MKLYRTYSEYPKGYPKKHPIGFLISFIIDNVILRHKPETEENFGDKQKRK
jgi:hypothetical protein